MKYRSIKNIVYAATFDMGGMPVRQALPSAKASQIDPFLLLHHANIKVPTHIHITKAGIGPHPHRGFSPVTFIFEGGVHHRDSRGNDHVLYKGGTQWMNAGMGVVHSERPPKDIFEKGGHQEIIQLWVNSPSINKMDQPVYYPLAARDTPMITSDDGLAKVMIHSGELDHIKGPIPTLSPVNTFTAHMKKAGKYSFNIPAGHNAFFYLLDGKISLMGDADVEAHNLAELNNDGEGFELEALEETKLIIGTGKPLNESIASHGPFVMNTQTEILQAFKDYEMGKMGVLIEE